MVSAIVVDHAQERNFVMRGSPQDSGGVHHVAIVLEVYRQSAVLAIGDGRAGGSRSTIADAGSACSANILVVFVERPKPQGPVADGRNC